MLNLPQYITPSCRLLCPLPGRSPLPLARVAAAQVLATPAGCFAMRTLAPGGSSSERPRQHPSQPAAAHSPGAAPRVRRARGPSPGTPEVRGSDGRSRSDRSLVDSCHPMTTAAPFPHELGHFLRRTISYSSCSKKWPQGPTMSGTSLSMMRKNWLGMLWLGHSRTRT